VTTTSATGRSRTATIGFWTAVALVMGNMIGSGIFLLPSSLAPYGGLALVGWIVSAAGAVLLALCFARLARSFPAAGGPYAYTRRAFGDVPAFLVAWGYWISMWSTLPALAVAFVGYLDPFVSGLVRNPVTAAITAVGVMWLLIGVNIAGVRSAGRVQLVTTIVKILPLAVIGLVGLTRIEPSHFAVAAEGTGALTGRVNAAATLTLWAFLGLESATVPSGSITDPNRTIPRATIVGTVLAAVIYICGTVGVMSMVAPEALAKSTAPFADAARMVFGDWGARLVAAGAAVSCFGALNGWTLLVGQLPMAVARDGLFPRIFARMSPSDTPVAGLVISGVLATALVAMNYTRGLVELFTFIILLATLSTLVPFAFSALAVFLVPERPGAGTTAAAQSKVGAVVVPSLAFAYAGWAMAGAGMETVYWGFLLLICGLPVYVFVARREPTSPRDQAA